MKRLILLMVIVFAMSLIPAVVLGQQNLSTPAKQYVEKQKADEQAVANQMAIDNAQRTIILKKRVIDEERVNVHNPSIVQQSIPAETQIIKKP